MNSKLLLTAALAAMASFTACTFVFDVKTTTVVAQNDLTDLQVTVGGSPNNVTGVNLKQVTIGDVYFTAINAGTATAPETTDVSGTVDIDIGAATATVKTVVLGQASYTDVTISDIDKMQTDITSGEENTVIFDESTAGVVFSALAKKMAK